MLDKNEPLKSKSICSKCPFSLVRRASLFGTSFSKKKCKISTENKNKIKATKRNNGYNLNNVSLN